jgi:phosphoribosylanthranilate isomerase
LAAIRLGADAIGLVFYPPSPRVVTVEQAAEIARRLPPFVTVVALFVDAEPEAIQDVLNRVRIDLIQFHGDESPEQCTRYGRPWIKAVRVREDTDLQSLQQKYEGAAALLLDTYHAGKPGGTGTAFDWSIIPAELADSIVLAGGLTPDNVEQAVRQVRPYAVDVSGGVEQDKGIKDADKIAAFIRGVERANQ